MTTAPSATGGASFALATLTAPTAFTPATPVATAAIASTMIVPTTPSVASAVQTVAVAKPLAPDINITGQEKWFNSAPLTLAGLRGKPVFLVFWSDI